LYQVVRFVEFKYCGFGIGIFIVDYDSVVIDIPDIDKWISWMRRDDTR